MNVAIRRLTTMAGCLAILCAASLVQADATASDRAAARALFDQARAMAKEGKYAEACPKFEESQRLDPGIGTLFNLADCFEHAGRTATAWSLFLEVASQARTSGQADREKVARTRASSLEPHLSRFSIIVPQQTEVPGLEVRRDGSIVGKPLWGTAVPVDPGPHTLEASAPGKKKWTHTFEVGPSGATVNATIPPLAPSDAAGPVATPPAVAPPVSSTSAASPAEVSPSPAAGPAAQPETAPATPGVSSGSTQRTLGWIAGGVGLVGLGASAFFVMSAKGKVNDAKDFCNGAQCWDQKGVDLHDDARSQADLATIAGGVGAAMLVGGAVLILTAPSGKAKQETHSSRSPELVLGPGSMAFKGVW